MPSWKTCVRTAAADSFKGRSGRRETGKATTSWATILRARWSGTSRWIRKRMLGLQAKSNRRPLMSGRDRPNLTVNRTRRFVACMAPALRLIRKVESHFASAMSVNCNGIVSLSERRIFRCVAPVVSMLPQYLRRRAANLPQSMSTPFAGRSPLRMPNRPPTTENRPSNARCAVRINGRLLSKSPDSRRTRTFVVMVPRTAPRMLAESGVIDSLDRCGRARQH